MRTPTEPLRLEHRQIRRQLEGLRHLADRIDTAATVVVMSELDEVVGFLQAHMLPHALAEEEVLYPAVAIALGGEHGTDTMSRDHLEIARLVQELDHLRRRFGKQPTRTLRRDIRRVLYELEAIALLHLDKEDEVYLPLLDNFLSEEAVTDLFRAFETAARRAALRSAS